MDGNEALVETPEEAAFFENKGQTVDVTPQPELPLETPVVEAPKPEVHEKPDMIPLARFMQERSEYKSQIAQLKAQLAAKENPPEPEPDLNTDPMGVIKNVVQELQQLKEEKKAYGEVTALSQFAQRQAAAYVEKKADFYDAYNHLRVGRANQLMESGEVETPADLNRVLLQEEQDLIKMCVRWKVDPANFMYRLARSAGYAPKQAAPEAQTIETPTQEQKIQIASQGQKRASVPTSKANAGAGGPIDLKALAGLDGKEFDKATEGDNWRKLAGG